MIHFFLCVFVCGVLGNRIVILICFFFVFFFKNCCFVLGNVVLFLRMVICLKIFFFCGQSLL